MNKTTTPSTQETSTTSEQNTREPTNSKQHGFNLYMLKAKEQYNKGNWDECFYYLENAHILGQKRICEHTLSHVWMLKVGWRKNDIKELLGQLIRTIASPIITPIWVPLGNTGGANVSPLKVMPVRPELKAYFK